MMNQPAETILYLQFVEYVLKRPDPLYCNRVLNDIREEFIVDEAARLLHHRRLGYDHVAAQQKSRLIALRKL